MDLGGIFIRQKFIQLLELTFFTVINWLIIGLLIASRGMRWPFAIVVAVGLIDIFKVRLALFEEFVLVVCTMFAVYSRVFVENHHYTFAFTLEALLYCYLFYRFLLAGTRLYRKVLKREHNILFGVAAFMGAFFLFSTISRPARDKSDRRACMANMKTILGAIEMYELDNGILIDIKYEEGLVSLLKEHYLQETPKCPKAFEWEQLYYFDEIKGTVCCRKHGCLQ
jgi:hypothetical protein